MLQGGYIFIECTSGCRVISTQESVILSLEEKSRKSQFTSSRTPLCIEVVNLLVFFYYVCDFSAFFYRLRESRYFSVQQKTTLSVVFENYGKWVFSLSRKFVFTLENSM